MTEYLWFSQRRIPRLDWYIEEVWKHINASALSIVLKLGYTARLEQNRSVWEILPPHVFMRADSRLQPLLLLVPHCAVLIDPAKLASVTTDHFHPFLFELISLSSLAVSH